MTRNPRFARYPHQKPWLARLVFDGKHLVELCATERAAALAYNRMFLAYVVPAALNKVWGRGKRRTQQARSAKELAV